MVQRTLQRTARRVGKQTGNHELQQTAAAVSDTDDGQAAVSASQWGRDPLEAGNHVVAGAQVIEGQVVGRGNHEVALRGQAFQKIAVADVWGLADEGASEEMNESARWTVVQWWPQEIVAMHFFPVADRLTVHVGGGSGRVESIRFGSSSGGKERRSCSMWS